MVTDATLSTSTTRCAVHHGDCRDVLPTIGDASVDAIITDPPYELGFMGKRWDASGIAYDLSVWRECLRVIKPGGHLLAFGGTRTYHRMACAIEDAGFEIRDSIHWLYGSGFPKSLDVSKAIDKRGGNVAGFEQFRDAVKDAMKRNGVSRAALTEALGNHMLSHYLTAGSQPAVPNTDDYRIIRDTVGLGSTWDDLFLPEAEREVVGSRDAAEFVFAPGEARTAEKVTLNITAPATDAARQWDGWGTALKPAHEPIIVARKPLDGTVAANVLAHGTGALNINGCRVNGDRWPANVTLDDDIAERHPDWAIYFYCAKADAAERNAGLDDGSTCIHPTVKPLDLMRWLCRLVTPPDGTILDPFAGSGTTLAAAILEGFNAVGIELTADYVPLIDARVRWAEAQPRQLRIDL